MALNHGTPPTAPPQGAKVGGWGGSHEDDGEERNEAGVRAGNALLEQLAERPELQARVGGLLAGSYGPTVRKFLAKYEWIFVLLAGAGVAYHVGLWVLELVPRASALWAKRAKQQTEVSAPKSAGALAAKPAESENDEEEKES